MEDPCPHHYCIFISVHTSQKSATSNQILCVAVCCFVLCFPIRGVPLFLQQDSIWTEWKVRLNTAAFHYFRQAIVWQRLKTSILHSLCKSVHVFWKKKKTTLWRLAYFALQPYSFSSERGAKVLYTTSTKAVILMMEGRRISYVQLILPRWIPVTSFPDDDVL